METPALFPDHKGLARILMEDINLPYDEWKEKVDKPIRPILNRINKSVQELVPSLHIFRTYKRSRKEAIQGRLRNSRVQWKYNNPYFSLNKDVDIFVQLGDHNEDRKETMFWGIEWWGPSNESEAAYQILKKVNSGVDVIKEVGGPGAGGTTILLVLKKYTADKLLNLKRDIKKEIAEDIKNLVQKMDGISKENVNIRQEGSYLHYVPNKEDFEKAYRTITSPGQSVSIDAVLNQIEFDAKTSGHKLKINWRLTTERNIEIWATIK
jgi:hypothetical protein